MVTTTEIKLAVAGMLEELQNVVPENKDQCVFLRNLRAHFDSLPIATKRKLFDVHCDNLLEHYFENRSEDCSNDGTVLTSRWNEAEEEVKYQYEAKNFAIVGEVIDGWVKDEMEKYLTSNK